ncbi:microsomal signal peptidase 25 kDa subunit-domain-containing protein [Thamnocephalis sphaerospora]|uniref:Signal peptidase complex subunit 2 n=1 Tax=Thamnocephalis sphaerospora TaxID=78915 RepID=A0A4P9XIJ0_9FUNG|nr:microsomal signal peptidase 25 kDa subunit-domain-containing protein [Thamnocephalis sphaerospora]|eukprot:RKP05523.1 microsomal signal peptidase 25 kDa subunit-domain-containing protein [Thamnocephalis sphaerospora]
MPLRDRKPERKVEETEALLHEDAAHKTTKKSEPVVVNNSSLSELKYACDDAVRDYLNDGRGYQQNHRHTDIKLLLGYLACAVALGDFAYSWKKPLTEFRTISMAAVIIYFVLSVSAGLYAFFFEGDKVYLGRRGKERISVSAQVKDYKPIYYLTIIRETTDGKGAGQRERTLAKPFADWFDVNGRLAHERLELDVASMLE